MSLDTFVLQAVIDECAALAGAKIVAIDHYGPLTIGLTLRTPQARRLLCLSVQPGYARLYIPSTPPEDGGASALLNVMRDHLLASTLNTIETVPNERIAILRITGRSPLGTRPYRLIAELIDRRTSLILVAEPDMTVLETLRRVRAGDRELFSGDRYQPPEPQKRIPLADLSPDLLDKAGQMQNPDDLRRFLLATFAGFSPALVREVVAYTGTDTTLTALAPQERRERLRKSLSDTVDRIENRRWTPCIGRDTSGLPVVLSALPIGSIPPERVKRFDTMSAGVERFYTERHEEERRIHRETQIRRLLDTETKRLEKLAENLRQDAAQTQRETEFRKYGELLMIHLADLERGLGETQVPDVYAPDRPLLFIPLDPALGPAENAARYFKWARKARDGRAIVEKRLRETQDRLERMRQTQSELATPVPDAVERAFHLCVRMGLVRPDPAPNRHTDAKKKKTTDIHPRQFATTDGMTVWVGRNSRENDILTRSAAPDDIWLHARDMGGSHVILRREGRKDMPARQALLEAAGVAAYFSKGRTSNTVPVDYTERRYVRKRKDGGPGQVVFTHEKTLFVEPKLIKKKPKCDLYH